MLFMLLELEFIMLQKMDYKANISYQLSTLFGLGRLPGGGTWGSLVVLLLCLSNNDLIIFIPMITLFIAPKVYKNSLSFFKSKDPKEFVLDEVVGMGLALIIVRMFSKIFGNLTFNFENYDILFGGGKIASFLNTQEFLFLLTFIFFRIYDISKVGPVGWTEDPSTAPLWWHSSDKNPKEDPYARVLGDDIMAALLAGISVIAILTIFTWMV